MGALTILPVAAVLAMRVQKKISDTIAPVLFFFITVLYVSGLFVTFTPGLILLHLICVCCTIFCIVSAVRNRARLLRVLNAPGIVFYLTLFVIVFLVSFRRDIFMGDDLHQWAIAVRSFFELNDFVSGHNTAVRMEHYPPALPLWNYYSVALLGRYTEWMLFLSQNMMMAVFSLPLVSRLKEPHETRNAVMLAVVIAMLPLMVTAYNPYGNLHDGMVHGFLAAYILMKLHDYYVDAGRFDLSCAVWGIFVLGLVKEFAASTAVLVILTFLLALWRDAFIRRRLPSLLYACMALTAALAAAILSWQFYLIRPEASGDAAGAITAGSAPLLSPRSVFSLALPVLNSSAYALSAPPLRVVEIFQKVVRSLSGTETGSDVILWYVRALFDPSYSTFGYLQEVSFPVMILLLGAVASLYHRFCLRGAEADRALTCKRILFVLLFAAVPAGFYFRAVRYTWMPGQLGVIWESYLIPYLMMGALFFLYYLLYTGRHLQQTLLPIIFAAALCLGNASELPALVFDKPQNGLTMAAQAQGITFTADDRVLLIDNMNYRNSLYVHDIVYYKTLPAQLSYETEILLGDDPELDIAQRLHDVITSQGCLYVYVGDTTNTFRDAAKALAQEGVIRDYTLYQVGPGENGRISLFAVGRDHPYSHTYRLHWH